MSTTAQVMRTATVATTAAARGTRRAWRRAAAIALGSAALIGALGTGVLSAAHIQPLVIISGSMEPGLPVGSVVYSQEVDASTLEVGDVVTTDRFNGPGTVTHRVVDIEAGEEGTTVLTLKGDDNDGIDRETYEVTEVGIMRFSIPYVGLPQLWVQNALGIDPLTGEAE